MLSSQDRCHPERRRSRREGPHLSLTVQRQQDLVLNGQRSPGVSARRKLIGTKPVDLNTARFNFTPKFFFPDDFSGQINFSVSEFRERVHILRGINSRGT